MTLYMAQREYEQHGLVTLIHGDGQQIAIYDDDEDAQADWPIALWHFDGSVI